MFLGFLGQFKGAFRRPEEEEREREERERETRRKSDDADTFVRTARAQAFIKRWAGKKRKDGEPIYRKRGITRLLRAIFPSFDSDEAVLDSAEEILSMLGGMDGLEGFLAGWKAKSEGIIKGLKAIVGSK